MVAQILRGNSQNTVMTAPAMAAYIQSIDMAPERRQDPMFVRKNRAVERVYDPATGQYGGEPGNRYSIESYMPVPYNITMQLDIWTTNTTDKFQIIEQIMTVFNPSVQIQTTDNVLDWTSIFEVELTNINWSSRGVPAGTDDANDFASMSFKVPVWITPPAKVTRQRMVEQIVVNVFDATLDTAQLRGVLDPLGACFDHLKQFVITPGNFQVQVEGTNVAGVSTVRLLSANGVADDDLKWSNLFSTYGNVDANNGVMTLKTDDDIESTAGDIVGSIEVDENDDSVLIFTVDNDTLPQAAYSINAIIDPVVSFPGTNLPPAIAGQRYMLIDNSDRTAGEEPIIPLNASGPWGAIVAYEYDIIEYDGSSWRVVFDSRTQTAIQYVVNIDDGQHYKFVNGAWIYTYLGAYSPGYWRIEV